VKPLPSNIPSFLDNFGKVSLPWLYFFQSINGAGEPIDAVTVGASPFSFTASQKGNLLITGGTVSQIQIQRAQTTLTTGLTSGFVPVSQNDIVIVTYTVLPTIKFIPG
jgi:hypothetical protein